jgi:hypothetical protein
VRLPNLMATTVVTVTATKAMHDVTRATVAAAPMARRA